MFAITALAESLLLAIFILSNSGQVEAAAIRGLSTPSGYNWTTWHTCPDPRERELGMDCADLQVPIDWENPYDGKMVTLRMNRIKARNPHSRIGSLIFNPGGPGDTATGNVLGFAMGSDFIQPMLLERFDINPRGVGYSTPIRCDPDIWNTRVSLYPTSAAEFDELVEHNKAFVQSCIERSGELVGHVDTVSVAKDMEAVRIAIGGEKLNFVGLSYGTTIGAQYAELFPDNIRAMVLDGVTDHSEDEVITQYTESMGYEQEFIRFAEWCTVTKDCKLYGRDIEKEFLQLIEKAEKSPLPALKCDGGCRDDVTWWEFLMNMQDWLIDKKAPKGFAATTETWYDLARMLSVSFDGDASGFSSPLALSDRSGLWQGLMVNCLDYLHQSKSLPNLRSQQLLGSTQAKYTRGAQESYTPSASCLGWPYPVRNPPHPYNVSTTAPPILLVNSFYDPETPMSQAVSVQEQIPTGVLLLRHGDGHQSFILDGEASGLEARYLVDLTVPAPNTVVES